MPKRPFRSASRTSHAPCTHAGPARSSSLGIGGQCLLNRSHDVEEWEPFLCRLGGVDWARTDPDWEGRILIGGRVARTFHHVALTADYLHERVGPSSQPV
ncbi:DNA sulfur modification protein DndB [Streptomyces sp. NPDC050698]